MALTRKFLSGMGLTEEQVGAIVEANEASLAGVKDKRDELQETVNKLEKQLEETQGYKQELDKLKADVEKGDWESKYTKLSEDFEAYKKGIAEKETADKVRSEYRKLLAECNVGAKQIDAVLKVTDLKNMKLDADGKLENADELKKAINADWGAFIGTEGTKPSGNPETPPAGEPAKKSRAAMIAQEYHDNLYGKTTKGD